MSDDGSMIDGLFSALTFGGTHPGKVRVMPAEEGANRPIQPPLDNKRGVSPDTPRDRGVVQTEGVPSVEVMGRGRNRKPSREDPYKQRVDSTPHWGARSQLPPLNTESYGFAGDDGSSLDPLNERALTGRRDAQREEGRDKHGRLLRTEAQRISERESENEEKDVRPETTSEGAPEPEEQQIAQEQHEREAIEELDRVLGG